MLWTGWNYWVGMVSYLLSFCCINTVHLNPMANYAFAGFVEFLHDSETCTCFFWPPLHLNQNSNDYKKKTFSCSFLAVCLRIQINPQNKGDFLSISPERAFADFLFAHTVLHLVVMNFIGWNWCVCNSQCPSQRCVFHPQTIRHNLCFSFSDIHPTLLF